MSVEVTCKKCGKQLRASDKYAGWRVECPQCQAMNQFPAMAEPLPEEGQGPTQAKPLPEASEIASSSKPDAPASQRPADAKAPAPAKTPPEVCSLCAKDFSLDADRVQDPQGRLFHRVCYEREQSRRQTVKRCTLCDRLVAINDMVQDPDGKTYHRRCYDRERARRLAATVRQQATPSRAAEAKRPSPAAPSRPAEVQPASPAPSSPPEEQLIADSSLLIPLPGPSDNNVVPANDLWGDLLPGSGDQGADALGPTLLYERPAKMSQGMYVLIGVGAAMPVLMILAMLIYSLTRPTSAPPAPAPNVIPSPAAPGTPGSTPVVNPPSPMPAVTPNPGPTQESLQPQQPFSPPSGTVTAPGELQPASPYPAPPPPPRPSRSARPDGFVTVMIVVVGLVVLVGTTIGAVFVRIACSASGLKRPGFGQAMFIAFVTSLVNAIGPIPFVLSLGELQGQLVALPVCFVADAIVFSRLLRVSFGKGIQISLVILMIGVAIGVAFVILGILLALILPALQALRRG